MRGVPALLVALLAAGCLAPASPASQAACVGSPLPDGCPGGAPIVPDPACVELAIAADRDALAPGENATFTLTMRNCGDAPVRIETSDACHLGRAVALQIDDPTGQYLLAPNQTAASRIGFVHSCPAETIPPGPPRLTLQPGATLHETLVWNGSAARDAQTWRDEAPDVGVHADVTYERLAAGGHELSWRFGNRTAHAQILLEGPARNATHLLVVREWDWRNGTAMPEPPAGACGPTLDAGGLRLPPGSHLDDYAALRISASFPTTAEIWGPAGGALTSPYDARMPLLYAIPTSAGGLYVNGTALAPGEETTVRVATPEGDHVLVARDVGLVPARVEPC